MVALAAGTFIYVGATEVIAEEFDTPRDKWRKFFALIGAASLGFLCWVAFVCAWLRTFRGGGAGVGGWGGG